MVEFENQYRIELDYYEEGKDYEPRYFTIFKQEEKVYQKYNGQYYAQPAYIEIDFVDRTVRGTYSAGINSDSYRRYMGQEVQLEVDPQIKIDTLNDIFEDEEFQQGLVELFESYEEYYDGNNYRGRFDEDTAEQLQSIVNNLYVRDYGEGSDCYWVVDSDTIDTYNLDDYADVYEQGKGWIRFEKFIDTIKYFNFRLDLLEKHLESYFEGEHYIIDVCFIEMIVEYMERWNEDNGMAIPLNYYGNAWFTYDCGDGRYND